MSLGDAPNTAKVACAREVSTSQHHALRLYRTTRYVCTIHEVSTAPCATVVPHHTRGQYPTSVPHYTPGQYRASCSIALGNSVPR
eukprot:3940824-Rhodomonas_salina.1